MKAFCNEYGALAFWRVIPLWSHWLEGEAKNPHWLGCCVSPHFTFFFFLSKQTECWSAENMMLSHFSCRVFKLGLWERVCYNSMTEVIPLSIWALNGPLKYSLVRKNFSKWCFLIFFYYYYSSPNRLQPGSENAVQSLLVASQVRPLASVN